MKISCRFFMMFKCYDYYAFDYENSYRILSFYLKDIILQCTGGKMGLLFSGFDPDSSCQCNNKCNQFNDCCDDYEDECGAGKTAKGKKIFVAFTNESR